MPPWGRSRPVGRCRARTLSTLALAGTPDGQEVLRADPARALTVGLRKQRKLARALSRKRKGSTNRRQAARSLG